MLTKRNGGKSHLEALSPSEEQAKFDELRNALGIMNGRTLQFCSDACLYRYLRANNWSLTKSRKMLRETIKWREAYKPEEIKWEEVAKEAETGKIYRAIFCDKKGRTVLVMRPGAQNTKQLLGQIRYLVYCMESAIVNMPPDQEQMVWLVDFSGWNISMIPVKTVRETAHILQEHYPERLAYAILYNPPKIFETFWTVVKPFLDPTTYKKVKFVFTDDNASEKLMGDLFDLDKLEVAFGGRNPVEFDREEYGKLMKEDDTKKTFHWNTADPKALDLNSSNSKVPDNQPCISGVLVVPV